jgi:hypothetical protein
VRSHGTTPRSFSRERLAWSRSLEPSHAVASLKPNVMNTSSGCQPELFFAKSRRPWNAE